MSLKEREIKIKPRIKLNHNKYIDLMTFRNFPFIPSFCSLCIIPDCHTLSKANNQHKVFHVVWCTYEGVVLAR